MITVREPVSRLGSSTRAVLSWPRSSGGRFAALLLAVLVMNMLLLSPQWAAPQVVPFRWLAGEAVVVAVLFGALPRRWWSLALALLAAAALVFAALASLGDAALRMSLSRPLNLFLDARLLFAVEDLLQGTLGPVAAVLAIGAATAGIVALVAVLGHLLAPPAGVRPLLWRTSGAVVGLVLVALALTAPHVPATRFRADLPAVRIATEQARVWARLTEERAAFERDLESSRASYADLPGLLTRLGGRDVVLAFVESYGTSAVDDPRYAPVVRPRLEDMARRLEAAGLHLATGTLVAPSQGGQSWLGHGSVLSGLWLDNQMRYDLMLASEWPTLIDDFQAAGYRTVALMPAITLAWPEGRAFGYDEVYAFRDIDYAGPALNWVTMPDQFTWSFLERAIRKSSHDDRPLFAEVGLISSHAPWTPILPVLDDWATIGDGSVFSAYDGTGERPEDLWRDVERVREHYALSIEYALHAATSYAERFVDDQVLLIVLGDHQPAPLITGDGAPRSVPVHVVSASPELVEPFLSWGFEPGAFANPSVEPPGMDHFRDWFVRAFSDAPIVTGRP